MPLDAPDGLRAFSGQLRAVALAFTHLRIVLEPGGAVALAAALWHLDGNSDVIVVASGSNIEPPLFREALDKFA